MQDGRVIPNRSVLLLGAALVTGQIVLTPAAAAQPVLPFYQLVDAAAQRLATADPIAAAKWINGGALTDPARANQVLDSAAADATAHGIDPQYVRTVFTDQIGASEGVQYTRFGQWKFDPATAPTTAPDLSASRAQIDGLNKTLVDEVALHWNSLHSQGCAADLADAKAAVVAARGLDPLYQQALSSATRSFCSPT
ncbi:chorismate mutase [Mycolicibacterium moriokaense]|jgi:chorismate mutase|uniref:chorismate mutase n=1 Tax=Mycolicibacterium moriokaense TaxID=39691 RepID=UPI0009F701E0|nr:chorismate mutase [Mycolicibacterium moriokaense]MCV7041111.1 chorismate mutase [Mycolicibacterium moriokaense]ORB27277.1 chorismate mutase [Mycolicibacterium moriokaense]